MTQELFYTSAPKGLRPGARGFCTVGSTAGMAKNLAEQLEALSGYRHIFSPHEEKAPLNPVVWSHLRLDLGGRRFHVLSRICASGLDYTQRSNKLAHHVVLDAAEAQRARGGPGSLLTQPGFMETTWTGDPRILPAGRKPPQSEAAASVCRKWQEVTGDAGWGGVLAETAVGEERREVAIIYPLGMDVLPLIEESLQLVPPTLRWGVTFSTYFTKLPPGIDCQWRCIVDDSPEAKTARRSQRHLLIDLCSPLTAPEAKAFVEAARSGTPPQVAIAPVDLGLAPVVEDTEVEVSLEPARASIPLRQSFEAELPGVAPPPIGTRRQGFPSRPLQLGKPRKRRSGLLLAAAASFAAVLLVVSIAAAWFVLVRERVASVELEEQQAPHTPTQTTEQAAPPTAAASPSSDLKDTGSPQGTGDVQPTTPAGGDTPPGIPETPPTDPSGGEPPPSQPPTPEPIPAPPVPADPPKEEKKPPKVPAYIKLPDRGFNPVASKKVSTELIKLPVSDQPYEVELLGGEEAIEGPDSFLLGDLETVEGSRKWAVSFKSDRPDPKTFANVTIDSQANLNFAWTGAVGDRFDRIKNCVLSIKSGTNVPFLVALREPLQANPLQFATLDTGSLKLPYDGPLPQPPAFFQITGITNLDRAPAHFTEIQVKPVPKQSQNQSRLGQASITTFRSDHPDVFSLGMPVDNRPDLTPYIGFRFEEGRDESDRTIVFSCFPSSEVVSGDLKKAQDEFERLNRAFNEKVSQVKSQDVDKAKGQLEAIQALKTYLDTLKFKAVIQFRVFARVGSQQVDIIRSDMEVKGAK